MAFNLMKIIKGLLITQEDTLTPKEIQIEPSGSAGTKTTIQSSQTTNVTLTLPDATDTLVGKATADTLTNKTIDAEGTGNSISNLKDANIKAAANIAFSKMAALTGNRALISSVAGVVSVSSVTDTELGYVSGVTSAIQTQLNGKEPSFSVLPVSKGGTNSSTALNNNRIVQSSGGAIVEAAAITADRVLISDVNGIPTHSTVTNTTLGYLDATSSIQTQLNGKEPTITTLPVSKGGTGASSFTAGSIVFSDGTKLAQDNSNLFFDDTNNRLGVGNSAPQVALEVSAASAPTVRISNALSTTSYLQIQDSSATLAVINKVVASGTSTLNISPVVSDGSSASEIGTFRNVNTSGIKKLVIYKGDGTSTADSQIAVGDSSYLNVTGSPVGIGTSAPNANAALDVTSTTKAFLPPRMTTTQKNAISSPVAGMVVFDSTLGSLSIYDGSNWGSAGGASEISFTLANNISSATNITSLSFPVASYRAFTLHYSIRRTTSSDELSQVGQLRGSYNATTSTYYLNDDYVGQDAGVTFSITAAGQVQYVSSNMAGTSYVGSLKYFIDNKFTV